MSDDGLDLSSGLRELSGVLLAEETLESTMQRIATVACRCVAAGSGAGVTLMQGGTPYTAAATDDRVRAVNDIQYELHEGPLVVALKSGEAQVSSNVGLDEQYPDVGPRLVALGISSVIAVPMLAGGETAGALSVLSERIDAFTEEHVTSAELLAGQAAVVTLNTRAHEDCQERIRQLQEALDSRVIIEQAKGVLMERHASGADAAYDRLRTMSQMQNRRMRVIAEELLLAVPHGRGKDGPHG